jgi:hypothetical protein
MWRSWSIDCVLISNVFWRSCTLINFCAHFVVLNHDGLGDGYTPTPTLTTRMCSGGSLSAMIASAIA